MRFSGSILNEISVFSWKTIRFYLSFKSGFKPGDSSNNQLLSMVDKMFNCFNRLEVVEEGSFKYVESFWQGVAQRYHV